MSINASAPIPTSAAQGNAATSKKINPLLETGKGKSEDHFSFWDLLDVVNPLQHIPIVSNIYRSITGDQINNAARIAGDTLYGGVVGAVIGVANAVAVHTAGDDIGGVALSKMGLLKSQEEAQAKQDAAKTADAIPSPDPLPAIDLKNLPVVEVHPMAKAEGKDQSQQVAEAQPLAMPTAKQLNDIEPVSGTTDPSVNKADVQKNMMDAWDKYKAMKTPAASETGMIQPKATVPAATQSSDAPKNIFAMPAAAPVNMAQIEPSVVKKPTAAFNKLRRY